MLGACGQFASGGLLACINAPLVSSHTTCLLQQRRRRGQAVHQGLTDALNPRLGLGRRGRRQRGAADADKVHLAVGARGSSVLAQPLVARHQLLDGRQAGATGTVAREEVGFECVTEAGAAGDARKPAAASR